MRGRNQTISKGTRRVVGSWARVATVIAALSTGFAGCSSKEDHGQDLATCQEVMHACMCGGAIGGTLRYETMPLTAQHVPQLEAMAQSLQSMAKTVGEIPANDEILKTQVRSCQEYLRGEADFYSETVGEIGKSGQANMGTFMMGIEAQTGKCKTMKQAIASTCDRFAGL